MAIQNNATAMDPKKPPNAAPEIAWLTCRRLFKLRDSYTTGIEAESPGIPYKVAGTLPTYMLVVYKPVYTISNSIIDMSKNKGKTISMVVKGPSPGTSPANSPSPHPIKMAVKSITGCPVFYLVWLSCQDMHSLFLSIVRYARQFFCSSQTNLV